MTKAAATEAERKQLGTSDLRPTTLSGFRGHRHDQHNPAGDRSDERSGGEVKGSEGAGGAVRSAFKGASEGTQKEGSRMGREGR